MAGRYVFLNGVKILGISRRTTISETTICGQRTFIKGTMTYAINPINFEKFKNVLEDKSVTVVDVREPHELKESGVIPGSVNIPLGEVESALKNLSAEEFKNKYGIDKPGKDNDVVFSCRSGKRSTSASEIASKLGYTKILNYTGGWLDWESKTKK